MVLALPGLAAAGGGGAPDEPVEREAASVQQRDASRPEAYQAWILDLRERSQGATDLFGDAAAAERLRDRCARVVRELERELAANVAEAGATRPPVEAERLHGAFVAAARASVAEISLAAGRVEDGEVACGEAVNAAIYAFR